VKPKPRYPRLFRGRKHRCPTCNTSARYSWDSFCCVRCGRPKRLRGAFVTVGGRTREDFKRTCWHTQP
jgi:hypothetical protein